MFRTTFGSTGSELRVKFAAFLAPIRKKLIYCMIIVHQIADDLKKVKMIKSKFLNQFPPITFTTFTTNIYSLYTDQHV